MIAERSPQIAKPSDTPQESFDIAGFPLAAASVSVPRSAGEKKIKTGQVA
jgi:hypothetical protein